MLGEIFRYGTFANIYGKKFDLHPSKCMYIGTPSVDALKVTVGRLITVHIAQSHCCVGETHVDQLERPSQGYKLQECNPPFG